MLGHITDDYYVAVQRNEYDKDDCIDCTLCFTDECMSNRKSCNYYHYIFIDYKPLNK